MAAIYSNGGNRWNILGFNFTKRDALSSVYKISMGMICGMVWCVMIWCDSTDGVICCSMVCLAWYNMICCGMAWYNTM